MRPIFLVRWVASACMAMACSTVYALSAGQPSVATDPATAPTASAKAPSPAPAPAAAGVGASLQVRPGVVTDLQTVAVENKNGHTAQVLGGVAGGLAGVLLTKDSDWGTRALAGTAGAALGTQAAKYLTKPDQRLRITLRLDSGHVAVVEQDMDEQFQIGQRVNLVGDNSNGKVRSIAP